MSQKFFDREPSTWQELEDMVNLAFCEMGYKSTRNQRVDTVRGQVNIDVFAIDERTPIPTIVVCECKYWNKPVEQQVIYAFRSVCADVGVHYGLIISKKGFQPGAENSRGSTNVHLLDFSQFQETFFNQWREGVIVEIVKMRDKFLPSLYKSDFQKTFRKYSLFEKVSDHFLHNNEFPITITDPRGDIDHLNLVTINSHRQFLDIAKEAFRDASREGL